MRINIKRGFNRLYIALALMWAAYCLVIFPRQEIREAGRLYGDQVGLCYEYSAQDGREQCIKNATNLFELSVDQWINGR